MAQKQVTVADIGEVILSKRRGSTGIRLSINARGQVRVGMPYWLPYNAGLSFLHRKKDWLTKQLAAYAPSTLQNGSRIGKEHRLIFYNAASRNKLADTRITASTIKIRSLLNPTDPELQRRVIAAAERALKMEADRLLPARVAVVSRQNRLKYGNLRIRKLTSRWGSCSNRGDITLSYFLIQLPWELIDYVILHELAHTRYHNHGPQFWSLMEERLANVRELRRRIKLHRPRIEPQ